MQPAEYNMTIRKGFTFHRDLTWKDANGNPYALSTYTAELIGYDNNGNAKLTLTTANGGITLGNSTNNIQLNRTAVQTALLAFDVLNYTLKLIAAGGEPSYPVLAGTIALDTGATL